MLTGETVTVIRRDVETGKDHLGNPIYEDQEQDVDDVLTAPGPRNDLGEPNRPDGVRVSWNLHMPKAFTDSLRGASIKVRDDVPRAVIGDPQPFMAANTPGRWNRPVELEGTDG